MNVRSTRRILKDNFLDKQDLSDAERLQTSFENGGFSPDDDREMEKLLATLERQIQTSSATLETSKADKISATKHYKKAKSDIESRKKAVKLAILKYVQSLHQDLTAKSQARLAEIDRAVDELENRIYRMKKTQETYAKLRNPQYRQALSDRLTEFGQEIADQGGEDAVLSSDQADHSRYHVVPKQSDEELCEIIEKLLGTLVTSYDADNAGAPSTDVPEDLDRTLKSGADVLSSLRRSTASLPSNSLLATPELLATFSCHLRKDKRSCGITDVAMTDDGSIFVVDKHNKAVKLYDSNGVFDRYVGHAELRRPSRVSFLPLSNDVIVSDDDTRTVHSFASDGVFQRDLIRMRFPVGHCQMGDGRIAIIEFATKSVVICNVGGKIESSFPTRMDCPAYIACTRKGHLVVSDWKTACVKAYDVEGAEQRVWTKNASGEVFQPYGVCTDARGHVIIADRTGRDVVIYDEDGALVRGYDDEKNKVGIPFAIAANSTRELMVIAEYSGTVRVYKYLAASSASDC